MELNELDKAAKKLYETLTANDPNVHTNRFPTWDELLEQTKDHYRQHIAPPENFTLSMIDNTVMMDFDTVEEAQLMFDMLESNVKRWKTLL